MNAPHCAVRSGLYAKRFTRLCGARLASVTLSTRSATTANASDARRARATSKLASEAHRMGNWSCMASARLIVASSRSCVFRELHVSSVSCEFRELPDPQQICPLPQLLPFCRCRLVGPLPVAQLPGAPVVRPSRLSGGPAVPVFRWSGGPVRSCCCCCGILLGPFRLRTPANPTQIHTTIPSRNTSSKQPSITGGP